VVSVPPFDHMKAALMTGLEEHKCVFLPTCICVCVKCSPKVSCLDASCSEKGQKRTLCKYKIQTLVVMQLVAHALSHHEIQNF